MQTATVCKQRLLQGCHAPTPCPDSHEHTSQSTQGDREHASCVKPPVAGLSADMLLEPESIRMALVQMEQSWSNDKLVHPSTLRTIQDACWAVWQSNHMMVWPWEMSRVSDKATLHEQKLHSQFGEAAVWQQRGWKMLTRQVGKLSIYTGHIDIHKVQGFTQPVNLQTLFQDCLCQTKQGSWCRIHDMLTCRSISCERRERCSWFEMGHRRLAAPSRSCSRLTWPGR